MMNAIYNFFWTQTRWRALSSETFLPVLKIEGNFSGLRAKLAHLVGHLPPLQQQMVIVSIAAWE
jgi:hypothetical protein